MPIPMFDPAQYRAMCEPHASAEAAGANIEAFFDEVAELRKKYRIADVYVITQTPCLVPGPVVKEGLAGLSMHLGDAQNRLTMTGRVYAQERKNIRDMLDRMLAMTDGPDFDR